MQPIRTLALVVNETKPGAAELADDLIRLAAQAAVTVRRSISFPVPRGFLDGCDACCVIGGDGTLLGIVPEAARSGVPVIGVNRGGLGFLTTLSPDDARHCFPALLRGEFHIAERSLLSCSTGPGREDIALNDILIKDATNSKLVNLEVTADGQLVTDYFSDGLIISTPTGSTAYNLSAGGPIIHPDAGVIAMTPICPHTLSNRSIIFRHDVQLRIHNGMPDSQLQVTVDGQRSLASDAAHPVAISMSPTRLRLVQSRDYAHFSVMRAKLKWSGGLTERAR